uniref:Uncharacterized protein n=1 Tax=Anguilla anguilla TaxID=7936 RepID=A0A0E9PNX5_ANGAN
MQIARSGSAACVLKGKIYVIGGWHASTENTDKVEYYDPKSNQWTMCAPMKERRYRPGWLWWMERYTCSGEKRDGTGTMTL